VPHCVPMTPWQRTRLSLVSIVLCAPCTSFRLTVLSSDLRLRNDELDRVRVVGLLDGVVQNTDSLQEMTNRLDLVGEV
jgi:hypothetical protein